MHLEEELLMRERMFFQLNVDALLSINTLKLSNL